MPEATKTRLMRGSLRRRSSRRISGAWSGFRVRQTLGSMQCLSSHGPLASFLAHSKPYMLAVGPPTSRMVPLKSGSWGQQLGFPDQGVLAAPANGLPLVHGDGAEVALAVATPQRRQGKADGVEGPHLAAGRVVGMQGALVG